MFFCQYRLFFEHCDPHETLYFTIRKLCFRFLSFCFFLEKYRKHDFKIQAAFFPTKNTQKCSRERCFGCQNGAQLASERLKISKIVEKNRFLSDLFFERFFYAVKTLAPEARVMPTRLNYQGRGSPGSMTKVMLDGNLTAWEISPGSNTPLDRWSGEFSTGLPAGGKSSRKSSIIFPPACRPAGNH